MTSAYDLMRQRCGLSQQEAADFHQARLDTIKSWCSGRREAPDSVIDELRDLHDDIVAAGRAWVKEFGSRRNIAPSDEYFIDIVEPRNDRDARFYGWPNAGAALAAVGVAISALPRGVPVKLRIDAPGATPLPRRPAKTSDQAKSKK
jgi:hypothetical protein